ncbi:MAG: hypothetical protein SH820_05705 [Xanthomonadales bacterium]|nr:hypothetical protein [Xanthomonadales bacterium]
MSDHPELTCVCSFQRNDQSHNNQPYVDYVKDEITPRYADNRLPNVKQLIVEADGLQLADASFDTTLAILTWHDFYYGDATGGWPEVNEAGLVNKLCRAMKPGSVLGIIDHVAEAGADPERAAEDLHRVDPQRIKDDLAGSCFELEAEAQFLRNPDDQINKVAMDPAVRGKTDRVIFKYRRKN